METNDNSLLIVNTESLSSTKEYICWIDVMGTRNIMSESHERAANFILRFHSCVIKAIAEHNQDTSIQHYPVMDGVFITTPNKKIMGKTLKSIFKKTTDIFLSESINAHKFIIRGSLAFGALTHGLSIDQHICKTISENTAYKNTLLFGMPMIQAITSEINTPPFGIYIHESARTHQELQGKTFSWAPKNVHRTLRERIIEYFDWCMKYSAYLEMDENKIKFYKKLTEEYFSDRMS